MATRWRILLSIALLVFLLDQATKFQAVSQLTRAFERDEAQTFSEQLRSFAGGETLQRLRAKPVVLSRDFLRLKYVENPGAAWGMFGGLPDSVRVPFFFVISMVAITFILLFYRRLAERERLLQIALALVMGGALGNFTDRILRGYVIDFIDLHWRNDPRLHWPTFNVADIAISVGVALLLSQTFFGRRHPFGEPQPAAAAAPMDPGLLSERPVSATEAEAAILTGQPGESELKE